MSQKNKAFQSPGDYVAYHSASVMGRDFKSPKRIFRFLSGKPKMYLLKAVGCRAWVISSKRHGSRNEYWLAGMFEVGLVRREGAYFVIQGPGIPISPPINLTSVPWFTKLRQEQTNFSFGFNRILDLAIVAALDRCLDEHSHLYISPDEVTTPSQYLEGATHKVSVNYYERNDHARNKCINHYGCHCAVCGFNFENRYGEIGRGFIHVHHLKPLADIRAEYRIDPVADLRPICPNCHAMIHSGNHMLSIEELKKMLI